MPDASELGENWLINTTVVSEYGEAEGNDDLETCGLIEPPTLEGIEVSYTVERQYDDVVTFVVNRGTAAETQSYLEVFRALPACDLEVLGFFDGLIEITTETITVDGADDALIMRVQSSAEEQNLSAVYVFVRYGELLVAMTSGSFSIEGPVNQLSADQMLAIIERAADRF